MNAPSAKDQQARFGPLEWKPAGDPASPERIVITNGFEADKIRRVTVPQIARLIGASKDGATAWNRLVEIQLQRLWKAWSDAGLLDRALTWAGSYNPRLIRGSTTKLSNHAFGAAFDINAEWNPLGHVPALAGARGSVRELVPNANRLGFFWGGHYVARPDGMHFEVAQLMTGSEMDEALAAGEAVG